MLPITPRPTSWRLRRLSATHLGRRSALAAAAAASSQQGQQQQSTQQAFGIRPRPAQPKLQHPLKKAKNIHDTKLPRTSTPPPFKLPNPVISVPQTSGGFLSLSNSGFFVLEQFIYLVIGFLLILLFGVSIVVAFSYIFSSAPRDIMDASSITTAVDAMASSANANASSLSSISASLTQSHNQPLGVVGAMFTATFYSVLWLIQVLPRISLWCLSFTTYTFPTFLFTLFSTSVSFTMNFTTLLMIGLSLGSGISYIVRYRYLNMYARLPPEPQRKEQQIDLFPDTQEGDSKSGLSSYLDEFLSAIKVFGYLERPVFHELTRHMQTRKLIAGETFLLEEEKGFCLVVDGLVEVFVKSHTPPAQTRIPKFARAQDDEEEENIRGAGGYQLLTEVGNGAPMSSLFTILSLFTEDVQLRQEEEEDSATEPSPSPSMIFNKAMNGTLDPRRVSLGPNHSVSAPQSPRGPPGGFDLTEDTDVSTSMVSSGDSPFIEPADRNGNLESVPSEDLLTDRSHVAESPLEQPRSRPASPTLQQQQQQQQQQPNGDALRPPYKRPTSYRRKKSKSVHPDIVGRATVDTTIAVIPAAAFKRLTRVYPKASAHIVQVILTRFQRVTFATAQSYLGLTSEVLRAEKFMNKYTMYELPNYLRGDALERLKRKFDKEKERGRNDEDQRGGIVLHNTATALIAASKQGGRKPSHLPKRDFSINARLAAARGQNPFGGANYPPTPGGLGNANPGDLWSSFPFNNNPRAEHIRKNSGNIYMHHKGAGPSFGAGWTTSTPSGINTTAEKVKKSVPGASNMHPLSPRSSIIEEVEELDDGTTFREAVLECILKAIGLPNPKAPPPKKSPDSVGESPHMASSFDSLRQKAVFNAFGYFDHFDNDGDAESITSATSISAASTSGGNHQPYMDMKNDVEIVYFPKGAVLVEQGERNPGLYYVIDGFLDVSISVEDSKSNKRSGVLHGRQESFASLGIAAQLPPLQRTATSTSLTSISTQGGRKAARKSIFMIKPGGVAGYIGSISGNRSFVEIRAKTDVYVGFLPRSCMERIADRNPIVLLTMAKRLTSLLPRLILHIDFALEWLQVNSGQVMYHQDDDSDAIYIVLNGRLRAVKDDNGTMHVEAEYGQGESVGELEVLTETARPATLHAIRDTEVVRFPKQLFNSLAQEHPGITMQISKIIAARMRTLVENPHLKSAKESLINPAPKVLSKVNLRTVCILPVTAGVPVTEFSQRLSSALLQIDTPNGVMVLNQSAILNHLGRHAFSRMGKLKLAGYLADLEEKYGMVLYVADTSVNAPWTQTCISQADCILLVALAESDPSVGEYERFLVGMKTTARKELVLLHVERFVKPGLTRRWLRNRMWVNGGHHHIQMAFRTNPEPVHAPVKRLFGSAFKQRVQILQAEITKYTSRRARHHPVYSAETPFKGDFHRLARRLCGKAVGLVLGGGGARGISQVGVIRALEEEGIPVDIIGGTSIGAFNGGLYARDADVVPMYGWAKKFAGRMASLWRFLLDLTYPSVSYTTGHEFNRGIFKTFGNSQIEDFWIEFYCNTTSISKSQMEIHTSGYAWRYIRASMSLAGMLPPLCDEGNMLLDGGYVDNLTVAHMKSLGADVIFAVDVGSLDDDTPQNYGDTLSGAWTFFNRWNPFSTYPNPPTLAEVQARLAYVSSVDNLERAKRIPGCMYMRPPIDPYGTLDFGKFDEIYKVGYDYGKKYLQELRAELKGTALGIQLWGDDGADEVGANGGTGARGFRRTRAGRRASI